MILSKVRDYLRKRGRASLSDLSLHFDTPPEAMRGMLEQWIRRGKVRVVSVANSCDGCVQCDPNGMEVYEWADSTAGIDEAVVDASLICRR